MSVDKEQGAIDSEKVMKLISEAVGQIIEGILSQGRDLEKESLIQRKLIDLKRLEKILLVKAKIRRILELIFTERANELVRIQDSHLSMSLRGARIISKANKENKDKREDYERVKNISFFYKDSRIGVHLISNIQEYRMSISELMQNFEFRD